MQNIKKTVVNRQAVGKHGDMGEVNDKIMGVPSASASRSVVPRHEPEAFFLPRYNKISLSLRQTQLNSIHITCI
jgi:hypothetical protein